MNPNPADHWRSPVGPPQPEGQPQNRPFAPYGPNGPSQPSHVLPPPPPSYHQQHHAQTSGSHSLSIADLTQGPQNQHQYNTQPPPQPQSHPISSMGHPHLPQHSPPYLPRDLIDRRDREMREQQEMRDRELHRQREEQVQRERELELDRQRMERIHREQQEQRPVQSHAGSIPIHQPVANKVQNSIHGPNGLLSNGGSGPLQQNGPSAGAGSLYTVSAPDLPRPQFIHQQVGPPSHQQTPGFMAGPSPLPTQAQLASGQQPILNDALSYLDQVKVRFSDMPDVYNQFLEIMKDFKSQAIDTPGVIERVSTLFHGHPALIQGFNTFLPPGYRIECGTDENPDAIRVTTPSGTMTQSLQNRGRGFELSGLNPANQTALNHQDSYDDLATTMQQQEQRGVSSLQSAVSAATNGINRPAVAGSPTPAQQGVYPQQGGVYGGADLKRGGPVEFNHAISYVNKIKNRFAQQPEIYKQFLEILQTYQRESKPIQDVYAQVTLLFHSAPDLLDDFKQFLPETAAHAKAQASARIAANEELSNVRGEPGYSSLPQAQTPRPAAKMPPMGQFDPPSTSKDNKKRRAGPGGMPNSAAALDSTLGQRSMPVQVGNANKRQKLNTQRQPQTEAIVTSPTLVPQLPEPLPPFPSIHTTQEELGFFDRAKKQIGNRASYAEFLKLINLYTQDLIDKYTLADRVISFIGSSPDLMNFFRDFLGIQEQEEIIEARARTDPGRVNLAHCRALGPSYRHLPKRDQNKSCKGRDGMCYQVLNDVWASHPTWASEDSGFVAHRKNQYEEALHRIEEERHDYDFHIESCQRTIQLMEPLVQQISVMGEADRASFQLAPGFGGASEAIPKRIILKVYGREVGNRVMSELFQRPTAVLPIVLARLKQKLEEWKATHREWDKVWRDQINKQFWKSLDHQGINAKNMDKKNFQHKTLTTEIQAKYEEGKKNKENGTPPKKHQLEYSFEDLDVIADAAKLVLTCLESDRTGYNSGEVERIKAWFLDFVPRFFGLNPDQFVEQTKLDGQPSGDGEMQDGMEIDSHPGIKSKASNSLFRKVVDKRNGKDDSASASKESTPIPTTEHDMDFDDQPPSEIDESARQPWINHVHGDLPAQQVSLEENYPHTTFNLYANANIYCFFRLFQMLYWRLLAIKKNEQNVVDAVARFHGADGRKKPAIDLRMIDKGPNDFFTSTDATTPDHYYNEILRMCDDVVNGVGELSHLEETLRRYYNKAGWQLYTVDKLVSALIRFIMNILGGDAKDKSVDITNLFFKDRERPDTTRRQEIQYRKTVERFSKDGEVYRISYVSHFPDREDSSDRIQTPDSKTCTIRLFPSEEPTFDSDALSSDQLWQYYVASFTMSEATEGVDQAQMRFPFMRRNIAPQSASLENNIAEIYANLEHFDNQAAFISPDTYKLMLSNDYIFWRTATKPTRKYDTREAIKERKVEEREAFREKFIRNTAWMKDQQPENVGRRKAGWEAAVKENLFGYEDVVV